MITSQASTASSSKEIKLPSETDSITQRVGIIGSCHGQIVLCSHWQQPDPSVCML